MHATSAAAPTLLAALLATFADSDGRFKRIGDDMLDRLCAALNAQPGELLEVDAGRSVVTTRFQATQALKGLGERRLESVEATFIVLLIRSLRMLMLLTTLLT